MSTACKTLRSVKEIERRQNSSHSRQVSPCFVTTCPWLLSDTSGGWIRNVRTQMETHITSEMVVVLGMPCAIPPSNSNSSVFISLKYPVRGTRCRHADEETIWLTDNKQRHHGRVRNAKSYRGYTPLHYFGWSHPLLLYIQFIPFPQNREIRGITHDVIPTST
jgi:hypothetical protein